MSHVQLEPQVPAARLVSVDGKTYPLESAELKGRAEGGMAMSTLAQTFANPYAEPLEVLYTLPLPADGAVLGYTITIGERVIRGEVQPREKAAAAYKQALYEGRTAGLLEQQRADTFEQKLGNVPPGTKVQVSIDVLHPLAFLTPELSPIVGEKVAQVREARRLPQWEYRFPTVVGVRYHGAPGRVSDQEALSPDRGATGAIPTKVQLTLTIADEFADSAWSPSHRVQSAPDATVTFAHDEALDRDVVVRWAAASNEVGVHMVEGAGLSGDDGRYALVTVVPPTQPAAVYRRDLTVLLDSSGSMGGLPLELAKVVVGDLLRSLAPGDRFELLAFSNVMIPLAPKLTTIDERSLDNALAKLAAQQAGGGTEMASAVTEALKSTDAEAQRQVVLVTDGDISFEHEVVGRITAQRNVRLHVVGVGHVPNRTLTQQAAAAGRGLELLVASHADASAAARRLIAGTASPVLTQVALGGTAPTGQVPAQLRDVFAGQPLLFAVELSPAGGSFELKGSLAGADAPWSHAVHVPPAATPNGLALTTLPLGALYGRERVARLELDRAGSGYGRHVPDHQERISAFDAAIERTAMRHRIVSRRTSLVAIAEEPSVDPRAPRRRERLAVEVPAGVSAEGVGFGFEHARLVGMPGSEMAAMMDAAPMAPSTRAKATGAGLFDLAERVFRRGSKSADERVEREHQVREAERRLEAAKRQFEKAERQFEEAKRRREDADRDLRRQEWIKRLRQDLVGHVIRWASEGKVEIEFEIAHEGQFPQHDQVEIEFRNAKGVTERVDALVVRDKSSSGFDAAAGTLVRLTLQLPPGQDLPARQEIVVRWTSDLVVPAHDRIPFETLLHARMPERITPDIAPGDSRSPHPTE